MERKKEIAIIERKANGPTNMERKSEITKDSSRGVEKTGLFTEIMYGKTPFLMN